MSRIIIKGLRKKLPSEILKRHLSSYGTISDIKWIKNKMGQKKDYVFIGFLEKNAGEKCINDLNSFFLANHKLEIQKAQSGKKIFNLGKRPYLKILENKITGNEFVEKTKETGLLFVRNLPKLCKKTEIETLFKPFGFISRIKILKARKLTENSKRALVRFGLPECAIKAGSFLDGKIFKGKVLHIIPGLKKLRMIREKKPQPSLTIFKKTRFSIEKNSSFSRRSWFWFFIPVSYLIKTLSSKLNSKKNSLLSYRFFNLDLGCLTLSEGRLQHEIILYLEKEGINLNIMNPGFFFKKSKKIFFLRNFSDKKFLFPKKNFSKFGKLKKFIYLPFVNLIFVEYRKKQEALNAFSKLTDLKKKVEIFIDWAPQNCLHGKKKIAFYPGNFSVEFNSKYILKKKFSFLKTQNPEKKKENIKKKTKVNEKLTKLKTRKIPRIKKNFFSYKRESLLGRPGKLLIRNLSFRARIWELRNIFHSLGSILSIRMPKKKDGTFRGFAFVTYVTLEDAKNALFLLQNVHIYSRKVISSIVV